MKRTITATELKQNLGKYLDYVIDRHELVITKNGKNAVRLSPYLTDYDSYSVLQEESAKYLGSRPKVSYEEFMEINANTELRLEFLNGEIILLGSPSTDHQTISGNLHIMLHSYFQGKDCKVFYAPFDVHFRKKGIKDPDVLQPDLLVVCDLEGNVQDGRYMGTPALVLEILSPSTRSKDMVDKLNSYMLSGVQEYWIIDPKDLRLLVYSFEEQGLKDLTIYQLGDTVQSSYFEGLAAAVNDVFAS